MKTSVVKRVVALTLAGLIILGTLGYFFSVVGIAAENTTTQIGNFDTKYEITADEMNDKKIRSGEKVSFKITLSPKGGAVNLDTADTIVLDSKSGFVTGNDANVDLKIEKSGSDYIVTLTSITYQPGNDASKKGNLAFTIKNGTNNLLPMEIPISECETNSGGNTGGNTGGDDPQPTLPSNMTYTLQKVYYGSNTYFGDGVKNPNPDIRRNYLMDVTVQFALPGVEKGDVVSGNDSNVNILIDRGSFRFAEGATSKIERVIQADDGVVVHAKLTGLRYTGTDSTLAFTVQSKDGEPQYIFQQFTAEVSSCIPYVETPDDGDDDPDYSKMEMATPYVIVSNYSYGGQVTAGDTFPLSLTFYNTSRNLDVTNMMITITMPDAFMLTSSSNTFYVDQLDAQQSVTQTVQVTAKANAAPQSHNIEVSMKYQYIDDHLVSRRDNSTQETISIPVVQIDRFQVTGVDVSQEIYLNEESYLTVNFVNKGRSDVYNLSAQISGDIQNPGQQQNLGNLSSGSTGTADFYITPNGEGVCAGEVTITYEDTNMVEKTATIQWSTNAVDPMAGMDPGMMGGFDPGMMEDPGMMDEEKKSPVPFIIGGVVIAGGVAAFLIRRRILKKRSEEADANL